MANRIQFNESYPPIERSNELFRRAVARIPAATQTLAKGPTQYVDGVAPKFLARGKGARVTDVDGNEFLDLVMALGPLSLGYGYPDVDEAIRGQLADGISFSLVHPLEVEVAELICELVPCAQMVRFSKTGADVTSAAVRLSRAHTGRSKVLCCGYHGWHDWYVATTARSHGVPPAVAALSQTFGYNDLDDLARKLDDDTACVIFEPVAFELPRPGFLEGVRELCSERGAVLIFDEMWTGFRVALGGAQQHFGVVPDLACFSKAVANGMPLSVLAGRRDLMGLAADDVFFFTTFGGETLSLAAAKATIGVLRQRNVPAYLAELGLQLQRGLERICERLGIGYLRCAGMPCRTQIAWSNPPADPLLLKSFVQQELIKRGVLWTGFHALSLSHTQQDVEYLLSAYADLLPLLDRAVASECVREQLRGKPVQPVFRAPPARRGEGSR